MAGTRADLSVEVTMQGKNYAADPVSVDIRSVLGGALSADWRAALVARGYGWHISVGSFSSPITGGGAGDVLDADQPELVIDVPSGYCMVPLRVDVACQIPLGATDSDESEIAILVDRTAVSGAVAANGTVEAPVNMRTNKASGCPLPCVSAVTTNLSAGFTASMELAHAVKIFETKTDVGTTWTDLALLYEPEYPLFIIGPATLLVYWGGTVATTGFACVDVLAFDSTLVTGLS